MNKYTNKKTLISKYGMAIGFTLPFILFFVFFTIAPIVIGFVLSFFNYNMTQPDTASFIGVDNYVRLFQNRDIVGEIFWNSLGKTTLFALITVPFMIVIPLLLAVLINYEPPGYKVFRAILYLPCILSISTAGILFVTIFSSSENGLFNAFFGTKVDFLNETFYRWLVMLLLSIWWQTGTNFVIFSAALKNVPKSLYEACETDGGNKFQCFIHVTLPNIKGSLNICLFNTLIGYMSLYGQPTVIKGELTADSIDSPLMMLQDWISDITYSSITGYLVAVAIVFGIIIMIISFIERYAMGLEKGGHKHERKFKALQAIEK